MLKVGLGRKAITKKNLLIFFFIFLLCLSLYVVFVLAAAPKYVDVAVIPAKIFIAQANGTTIYNTTLPVVNASFEHGGGTFCNYSFVAINGSTPGAHLGTYTFNMSNQSAGNNSIWNATPISWNTSYNWLNGTGLPNLGDGTGVTTWVSGGVWRNISVNCTNDASNITYFRFRINEQRPNTINITPAAPMSWDRNASIFYAKLPFHINVSTNSSMSNCTAYFWNSTATNASFDFAVPLEYRSVYTVFGNDTEVSGWASNAQTLRKMTVKCQDAFGNVSWMNSSTMGTAGGSFFYYYIREFTPPEDIGFSWTKPQNESVYCDAIDGRMGLTKVNISTNATTTLCTWYGYKSATTGMSVVMENLSANQEWGSVAGMDHNETGWGFNTSHYNNMTAYCEDGWGNKSWHNTSGTVGMVYFKLDYTPPLVANEAYAISNLTGPNSSAGSNYLNITFNITDNNTKTCSAHLDFSYQHVKYNVSGILGSSSLTSGNNYSQWCYVNVSGVDFSSNTSGYVVNYAKGLDELSWTTLGSTSRNNVFYHLRAGWNIIMGFENKTLTQIASEVPNVTYVSRFTNLHIWKNFTTFTVGASTNADITAYAGNVTYVYVEENVTLIRRHYNIPDTWENNTIWTNSTTHSASSWNLVGVSNLTTANNTFSGVTAFDGLPYSGLVRISKHDAEDGRFCSVYRARRATSCPQYTDANLTFPIGSAMWVFPRTNGTINMTVFSFNNDTVPQPLF